MTTEAYSATLTHMTAAVQAVQAPSISRFVAAELRAEIARAGITQNEVARRLGVPGAWISRRLSPAPAREVDLTVEEVERFCNVVGSDAETVLVRALRARRDSNPKPSDSKPRLVLVPPGQVVGSGRAGSAPNRHLRAVS